MISCDVNVLVYAHHADDSHHDRYRDWLEEALNSGRPFGLPSLVSSGFLRIVTHPKVLARPLTIEQALEIVDKLRGSPSVVPMEPGPRHWEIFTGLCRRVMARGNTVPDTYLAALAIEHDAEWHTADRGFARFPKLRWRHPLDPPQPLPPAPRSP